MGRGGGNSAKTVSELRNTAGKTGNKRRKIMKNKVSVDVDDILRCSVSRVSSVVSVSTGILHVCAHLHCTNVKKGFFEQ